MCEHGQAGGGRQLHWHTMGFAGTRWQFSRTIKRLQTFINSFAAAAALPEKPRVLRDALTSCPSLPELWKWRSRVWTQVLQTTYPTAQGRGQGGTWAWERNEKVHRAKRKGFLFSAIAWPFSSSLCTSPFHCPSLPTPFPLPWDGWTFCSLRWHWIQMWVYSVFLILQNKISDRQV